MAGDTKHIKQSLLANFVIGVSKGIAAWITGSGAMVAETIHSFRHGRVKSIRKLKALQPSSWL